MSHSFTAFLLLVVTVALVPGLDFALIVRATLLGGRRRGWWTAAGIGLASALQGLAVALGLGAAIVRIHPLFLAIRWAGVAYLAWLGLAALRTALRGEYPEAALPPAAGGAWTGLRQGVLCNLTNPKILVFFLALLPQFVGPQDSLLTWVGHAWLLPLVGTSWLCAVVAFVGVVRRVMLRRTVRRIADAVTGVVLLGFGARLATEA